MTFAEAAEILSSPKNVRFADAVKVATHFFGEPRISGSHHIFKTPWPMDPRVNLQSDGSKAKAYQIRQLAQALLKLESMQKESEKIVFQKQENKSEPRKKK